MALLRLSALALCATCVVAMPSGSTNGMQDPGKECPAAHLSEFTTAAFPPDRISMVQMAWKRISGASRLATNHTLETLMPADFLMAPFSEYTAQCSHNTYALGKQVETGFGGPSNSISVDATSMSLALSLGYRCVEIDVWPRNRGNVALAQVQGGYWNGPKDAENSPTSRMKVTHHGGGFDVLNQLDLSLFIKNLLEWLEKDEQDHPASPVAPKLPVTISIENNGGDTDDENYLLEKFSWLNHNSGTGAEVQRILMPAMFKNEEPMDKFAAKGGARMIILKSKIIGGSTSQYKDIIAMKGYDEAEPSESYTSKSLEIGSMGLVGAFDQATSDQLGKVQAKVKLGVLVRTYPFGTNTHSENYNPSDLFREGAQMVCVNLQGICHNRKDPPRQAKCQWAAPGQKGNLGDLTGRKGPCDLCDRSVAAPLETLFETFGYDGYINYHVHSREEVAVAMAKALEA